VAWLIFGTFWLVFDHAPWWVVALFVFFAAVDGVDDLWKRIKGDA
jgi:hypothetical protein